MTGPHDPSFDDAGPAYLLGALEPDEAVAFERHMEGCDDCRAQVAHLKVAADVLPASVVQVAASPALKGRLMAIVNAEAELLNAASPLADRAPVAKARRSWTLPSWLGRPGFALAATVLVLAAGAVGGVAVFSGGSSTQNVVADVSPQGSKVELLVRGDEDHSTLTASGLPAAGEGRVYQVWLRKGTEPPRPTNALFTPNRSGTASVDVPGSLAGDDVLVTSEPDGGSQSPTRKPIIAVSSA